MSKLPIILLIITASNINNVQSGLLERSYEYVLNLGKNLAPSFMSMLDCLTVDDVWGCARVKAGVILEGWDQEVQKQRRMWQEAADAEAISSGRSIGEMPSKIGTEVEESLTLLAEMVNNGMARALGRKKHDSGGIDSITISTGSGDKKKMKKKKPKPPKIHLVHPMVMPMQKVEKGRNFPGKVQSWVIGDDGRRLDEVKNVDNIESSTVATNFRRGRVLDDANVNEKIEGDVNVDIDAKNVNDETKGDANVDIDAKNVNDETIGDANVDSSSNVESFRKGRGFIDDLWAVGEEALDEAAEHALESDKSEDGVEDKSSLEEQRGKKKKKKKAILKLLILGAVLKAKIGTILQILSFKLQVKFFLIALLGLGINLARLWIDIKNKHNHQPQKVIYYEHAQHQHHYDHEEDHGWGPWSRSIAPEVDPDFEVDIQDVANTPYRAHDRQTVYRPLLTKD